MYLIVYAKFSIVLRCVVMKKRGSMTITTTTERRMTNRLSPLEQHGKYYVVSAVILPLTHSCVLSKYFQFLFANANMPAYELNINEMY